MTSKAKFTLYGRSYCHLCSDMLAALETLRGECAELFEIEVIDIDGDSALVARYDELVPVLAVEGKVLCHYFLDVPKVREYLQGFG